MMPDIGGGTDIDAGGIRLIHLRPLPLILLILAAIALQQCDYRKLCIEIKNTPLALQNIKKIACFRGMYHERKPSVD